MRIGRETSRLRYVCLVMFVVLAARINTRAADAESELARVFEDYHAEYLVLFPLDATSFGIAQYNDQLQIDISDEFIAKERDFYARMRERLNAIDTEQVSESSRLMARVLEYEVRMRMERLDFGFERIPFNQFTGLPLLFAQLGSGASSQPFRSIKDYENWLARVQAFDIWTKAAIARFRQGIQDDYVLPAILVERMIEQMLAPSLVTQDLENNLFFGPINKFPNTFSAEDRKRLTAEFEQAINDTIIPAYRRLGEFLRDEYLPAARSTSGICDLQEGREQYRFWVRYWTTTDMSPDEIFSIGKSEVKRITAEMEATKKQMGFEGSLSEFFAYLRTEPRFKPFRSPEDVLGFFHNLRAKLEPALDVAFLNKPKTPFEIRRTEKFREKTASAEYMPGSADGSRPGIFYCPIPDASQFNITGGMESLFLHEALPGHHYQISLQQENENLPTFARFLWYGAYGEGWALYCESIGEELGLYSDPQQKIGALGDEMHRAIRLVVDVGIHWKGWTREQALSYMMDHEQISEAGAVAEIERYMAFTGQALSYKIGQLKISQLRRECEQRLGERFSLPHFHDMVLRGGGMPLSVLEQQIRAWDPK